MAPVSIFQLFAVLFVSLLMAGIMNIYFSDSVNHCDMTYMFEYPQFVSIKVEGNDLYPQYSLYSYSEGRFTEQARKMRFDGIPVLFLPGSSGSHMQVRSIASVALRKALKNALSFEHFVHFDFFTVSFNEELSGLFGGVLEKQLDFATMCQKAILELYHANSYMQKVPTSIIIIGHSMGGVIAKALLTHPSTEKTTNLVITLSAPIRAPVINMDMNINDFYVTLNQGNKDPELNQKVLLSFGGGIRDVMVPSAYTGHATSDLSALTTSIPGVWISADHLSIVWCKQFVLVLNKFLFSLIDFKTGQLLNEKAVIMRNAKRYFQANRSEVISPDTRGQVVSMTSDAFWHEDTRRIYQVQRPEITRTTFLMIRLSSFPQNRFAAIEAINVSDHDWLFGCNAAYVDGYKRYCKEAESLSSLARWTVSGDTNKRKVATVHLHDLMVARHDWTHVVVRIAPTRKPIKLNVDVNDKMSRVVVVSLPYILTYVKTTIIEETEMGALYYQLQFPEMKVMYQVYLLYVEPGETCMSTKHHATAEMHTPWFGNSEYTHTFTPTQKSPMRIFLAEGNLNSTKLDPVSVTLLLDPNCTYTISVAPSFYGTLGQLARYYTPLLVPYSAAILILVLRANMICVQDTGYCSGIMAALAAASIRPYFVVVTAKMAWVFLSSIPVATYVLEENFFTEGMFMAENAGTMLPIITYVTSMGVVTLITATTIALMLSSSQLVNRLIWRFLCPGGAFMSDTLSSMVSRAKVVCSVCLLIFAQSFSAPLALVAGCAVYAIVLSKMYEEYLEELGFKLVAKFIWRFISKFRFNKDDIKREAKAQEDAKMKLNAIKDGEESMAILDSVEEKNEEPNEVALLDEEIKHDIDEGNAHEAKETDDEASEKADLVVSEPTAENSGDSNENEQESIKKNEIGGRFHGAGLEYDLIDKELSSINFHTTIFFLWLIVAFINTPALVMWARNFKYTKILRPDPAYLTGVVLCACSGFLWQMDGPRPNLKHYDHLIAALFLLAILSIVLGSIAIFFVNYTITMSILLVTLQQLFDIEYEEEKKTPEKTIEQLQVGGGGDADEASSSDEETITSEDRGAEVPEDDAYERFKDVKEKVEFVNYADIDVEGSSSTC